MSAAAAKARGLKPLARVLAYASHAQEPEWFTTAPVGAIKKTLAKLGWRPHDADLYEINEAFAAVTMAAMHDVDIDHARVNVNGGACALGHPIGATGARILTTLIHALQRRGGKRGYRVAVHRRRRSRRAGAWKSIGMSAVALDNWSAGRSLRRVDTVVDTSPTLEP